MAESEIKHELRHSAIPRFFRSFIYEENKKEEGLLVITQPCKNLLMARWSLL